MKTRILLIILLTCITVQPKASDIPPDNELYNRLDKLISEKELDSVKSIVETYHIDFSKKSSERYSIMRQAAYNAYYDMFLYLAQLQPEDYEWQNTLDDGVAGGNLEIVKYIVEVKGADVCEVSTIEEAVKSRYSGSSGKNSHAMEILKYLISKGARLTDINGGRDIFYWAMDNCSDAMMVFLVEQGIEVDMNAPIPGEWLNTNRKWRPLAMALDENKFALAKLLVKKTDDYTFNDLPLVVYFADGESDSHKIIEFLIKEGINKEHYMKALIQSITYEDFLSVQLLLDTGIDISTPIEVNKKGMYNGNSNILHYADDYQIAELLISYGADIYNEIMLKNAWRSSSLLHALEDAGVSPPISQENLNIGLAKAAENGDTRTVEYALKRGAEVNSYRHPPLSGEEPVWHESVYKQTPLIKNANKGFLHCEPTRGWTETISSDVAKILLNAGAEPDITDACGKTALHYVAGGSWWCTYKEPSLPRSFWDRHRLVDAQSSKLMHYNVAHLLINSGANLNIQDESGCTPLILAAITDNHEVLLMLFDAQADITIKNNDGKSVFHYLDYQELLYYLATGRGISSPELISQKDLDYVNEYLRDIISQKQLSMAFGKLFTDNQLQSEDGIKVLKTLIRFGADVNCRINRKRALKIAKKQGNSEIVDILIQAGAK